MKKFQKLIKSYNKLHLFIRFGLNGSILFVLWFVFYKFFRNLNLIDYFYEEITFHITNINLYFSKAILTLFGYDVEIFGKTIKILGTDGVHLDRGCLGRNNIGLFAGFIIAYPGNIKSKTWYIPLGFFLFYVINTVRIIALAITVECCPENLDINHHIIFQYTVLGFMFLLWFVWIVWLRKKKNKIQKDNLAK